MSTTNPATANLKTLLPQIAELAAAAGEAVMSVYGQADFGTEYKEDASPLTLADLASHRLICGRLSELTPELPVLSEESSATPYAARRGWTSFWLVDPLDGTKEFVKRNGEFTVNIALIQGGRPVLGVVHAPVLETTYAAAEGLGARKEQGNSAAAIHSRAAQAGVLKVVASRSHAGAETGAFLNRLEQAGLEPEVLSIGSSLKLCLVAEGAAHLYPRFGPTMEWDTAAAQCVVEQAGGRVTTLGGEPLGYNKADLLNPYFVVSGERAPDWQGYLGAAAGG
jgi:3'(2'), 5'-bisphosphate nucleotidase